MPLFRFNSHPAPGIYGDGSIATTGTKTSGVVSAKSERKIILANNFGGGGFDGGFGGASGGFGSGGFGGDGNNVGGLGGGSSPILDRFNPIWDRLDEGSVVEEWIPRDASGLDSMFLLMYHRDHIAGTIVDLLSELIWSDFDLTGIEDTSIRNIFLDSLSAIDVVTTCPDITREFLVLGRTISSMIFDKTKGIFKDMVSFDPSLTRLTPIPVKGFDPKIDIIPSPAMRMFVDSDDPRDAEARKMLPEAFMRAIQETGSGNQGGVGSGGFGPSSHIGGSTGMGIPLDPLNTLFVARKRFNYDYIGTSLYTRLITFWALEKALINSTVTSARRRSRSIYHITAGIDNVWEPSPDELTNIANLFIHADEDPVGAVVATRSGITGTEVRSGTDFYKWADEWSLLNEGKLRALGANDALLSGDATYSNQETAKAFFMERAAMLRTYLTTKIFYNKLFPLLARIHGFQKRTQAELKNGVRIKSSESLTQRDSLNIPINQLIIPEIKWHKRLVYDFDEKNIEILEKMEEKGVPVHLRDWATAGSVDLDSQLAGLEEDSELRKHVAKWKAKYENPEGVAEEEAKLEFIRSLKNLSHSNLQRVLGSAVSDLGPLSNFVFWSENGQLGPLSAKEMAELMKGFNPTSNSVKALVEQDLPNFLRQKLNGDRIKADIAQYLMYRSGLTPVKPALASRTIKILAETVKDSLDKYSGHGSVYQLGKLAENELHSIALLSETISMKKQKSVTDKVKTTSKKLNGIGNGRLTDTISSKSPLLYSGVPDKSDN